MKMQKNKGQARWNNFSRSHRRRSALRDKRSCATGQALLEILIAVGIMSFLIATVTSLIVVTQRSLEAARRRDAATNLAQETLLSARTLASGDDATSQGYNLLYCPPSGTCPGSSKGTATPYHVELQSGRWTLKTGTEPVILEGIEYTRQLTIENMCRSAAGVITNPTTSGGADTACTGGDIHDPGTLRVTVKLTAPRAPAFTVSDFVTRNRNVASVQTDWSTEPPVATGTVVSFDATYDNKTASVTNGTAGNLTISGASGTLTSRVFDTQTANANGGGAGFNNMLWQGTVTAPAKVGLQLAVSNCSNGKTNPPACDDAGNWSYLNPFTCAGTYEARDPNTVVPIDRTCFWNKRYFRYRIQLCYGPLCTESPGTSPTVQSIVINWAK